MTEEAVTIEIGGREYIPARTAAEMANYTRDYVGQLCREKKLEAVRIGRNWYIHKASLLEHIGVISSQDKISDEKTKAEGEPPLNTDTQKGGYAPERREERSQIVPNMMKSDKESTVESEDIHRERYDQAPIEGIPKASFLEKIEHLHSISAEGGTSRKRLQYVAVAKYSAENNPLFPVLEKKQKEEEEVEARGVLPEISFEGITLEDELKTDPEEQEEKVALPSPAWRRLLPEHLFKLPLETIELFRRGVALSLAFFVVFMGFFSFNGSYTERLWEYTKSSVASSIEIVESTRLGAYGIEELEIRARMVNAAIDEFVFRKLYGNIHDD